MARTDGGAAVAVYHRGRLVVDMWGGVRTVDGDPWERDTLAMCWSTTKGVVATCAHVLADRGELDYDERVATYWPEFAQNGKGDITVRQVLSHSAGLHRLGTIIDHGSRILDWEHMTDALARAKPAYQPGTSVGYHALTFGWLVGELVRRISGIPIEKFVQKEIAEPLGLDGLYIGCPPEQRHRVAPLAPMGPAFKLWSDPIGGFAFDLLTRTLRALRSPINPHRMVNAALSRGMEDVIVDPRLLDAAVPAMNGYFDAVSLGGMYAMLAGGGQLGGVRILSEETVRKASEIQNDQRDRVVMMTMQWRLGYHRVPIIHKQLPRGYGHFGFGGSGSFCRSRARPGPGDGMQPWPGHTDRRPADPSPQPGHRSRRPVRRLGHDPSRRRQRCRESLESAQNRKPPLAAQPVEGGLHHRADVGVNFVDVGILAELGGDVDRPQHLVNDLGWQRKIGREEHTHAERDTDGDRQDLHPYALEPQPLGQPRAAGHEQLGLLTPYRNRRHDRHAGFDRGTDIAGPAVEVDDVLGHRRPERVIIPAWKHQHDRTRVQRLRSLFPAGVDDAEPAQVFTERGEEDAVVGQCVKGAVVSELVVKGRAQDGYVRCQHATGVIRNHQRAADGRNVLQPSHLCPKPSLDNGRDHISQLLDELRIPLRELLIVNVFVVHGFPCSVSRAVSRVEQLYRGCTRRRHVADGSPGS